MKNYWLDKKIVPLKEGMKVQYIGFNIFPMNIVGTIEKVYSEDGRELIDVVSNYGWHVAQDIKSWKPV